MTGIDDSPRLFQARSRRVEVSGDSLVCRIDALALSTSPRAALLEVDVPAADDVTWRSCNWSRGEPRCVACGSTASVTTWRRRDCRMHTLDEQDDCTFFITVAVGPLHAADQ